MKRMNCSWCMAALLTLGMASCADENLKTYEDVSRIYFKYADSNASEGNDDQITVNMGYDNPLKDDTIIRIPIKLMGHLAEVDRAVKVMVMSEESSATEGEDIEIVSAFLPANAIFGDVEVKIHRTERIDKDMLMARICLLSNENFYTDYATSLTDRNNDRNGLIYTIFFTAEAEKPSLWTGSTSSTRLKTFFGEYSRVKMNVIYEACKLTRDYFEIDPADNDPTGAKTFTKRFPLEITYGLVSQVNRYLARYKEEHGEPLLDENGFEVKLNWSNIQ